MNNKVAIFLIIICFSSPSTVGAGGDKIVGGQVVFDPDAYPWIVSVVENGQIPAWYGHLCGGTLIHPRWVLTAAHCVKDEGDGTVTPPGAIQVVLGLLDLTKTIGEERIGVSRVIPHPEFGDGDGDTPDSDIALLELDSPSAAPWLDPYRGPGDLTGRGATALGYGSTVGYPDQQAEDDPEKLRGVELEIVSNATCAQAHQGAGLPIDDSMLCAGVAAGGRDACHGDSGGPLLIEEGGAWRQAGIVSFGAGTLCAATGLYGVYARVAHLAEFVDAYVPDPLDLDGSGRRAPADAVAVMQHAAGLRVLGGRYGLAEAIRVLQTTAGR